MRSAPHMRTASLVSTDSSHQSSTGTDESETDQDHETGRSRSIGWKALLLLQFQGQFEAVIAFGIYFAYICSIMNFTFAFATNSENIPHSYTAIGISFIYCFDVIYAIDILSMMAYKNSDWYEMKHMYSERHTILVIMDIISMIPLDAVYYSLTHASMKLIYCLRLRYTLRIFRLMGKIIQSRNDVGGDTIRAAHFELIIVFTLMLVSFTCVLYYLECTNLTCRYEDYNRFAEILYRTASCISNKGFPIAARDEFFSAGVLTFTALFAFFYLYGFIIGKFLASLKQIFQSYQSYMNTRNLALKTVKKFGTDDILLLEYDKDFFDIHWKNRKAIQVPNMYVPILPEIVSKEVCLDMTWDGFKHSHLFRDRDVHFLRYMSTLIKTKFLIPGEPIFRQNHYKSSMVYVVKGIVQILSVKDGETPILSLSGGTCMGESSLFYDYPSSCNVICQSYSEVHILQRKDFIEVSQKYPRECKQMLMALKERFDEAKKLQRYMAMDLKKQERELMTLKWLKVTMEELFSAEDDVKERANLKEKQQQDNFDKYLFCPKYLDMLVISNQLELVNDTVFLRDTCPCVLQPESFVVIGWNTFIAILSLVFALIYPYYAFFHSHVSMWYVVVSYVVTFFYILDIYVIVSTGLKTKDGVLLSDISSIAFYKVRDIALFIDILSVFPAELVLLAITKTISDQVFVLLQMTRLLKLYKSVRLFDDDPTTYTVGGTYMRFSVYLVLLVYYIAAIFYVSACFESVCNPKHIIVVYLKYIKAKTPFHKIIGCLYLATQHVTLFASEFDFGKDTNYMYLLLIGIQTISLVFQIRFLSSVSIMNVLKNYDEVRLQECTRNIDITLRNLNVSQTLHQQVFKRLRCHIKFNDGMDVIYSVSDIHQNYLGELLDGNRSIAFYDDLINIPIFTGLPKSVIEKMCQSFTLILYAPGEVVTYAGEICKEMMFIKKGYCKVIKTDSDRQRVEVIGVGDHISVAEVCFDIPTANTVIALTYCMMLVATRDNMQKNVNSFPEVRANVRKIVKQVAQINLAKMYTTIENFEVDLESDEEDDDMTSFKNFGYKLKMETKAHDDFHKPFENLKLFGFVRYLFLRHTIKPNGRFMRYWEISRCVFAFLTAVLAPISFLSTCTKCSWHMVFIFLDATAWLDIYIRHYVCYFDENGIEISHPLKTAVHYWSHGFLMDFLGVLDVHAALQLFTDFKTTRQSLILAKCVRILQTHRILHGILYLENDIIAPNVLWTIIRFLPGIILIITTLSGFMINTICDFDPDIPSTEIFEKGVRCKPQTWITKSNFQKPLSPLRVHLYGLYFITSVLLGPGMGGFSIENIREAFAVILVSCFGFWMFIVATSKIITANLLRNADLTTYQKTMKNLVDFLARKPIDPKLTHEIIEYYEYVWRTKKGKNLRRVISNFNYALQEDVLYDIYGANMSSSVAFKGANKSFIRSILLNSEHMIIMKRGIISKVNDIHQNMFFILKGRVEVLGPDYNRLLVLPSGSLFGNIDSPGLNRQTLTMVAKGHVELLWMDSNIFHQFIAKYPIFKANYRRLVSVNTDYIFGNSDEDLELVSINTLQTQQSILTNISVKSTGKVEKIFMNIKQKHWMNMWESFIITFIIYFGISFELYRLAYQMHTLPVLIIAYFIDVIYLINIYVRFNVGYEDEFGILITDKKKIAAKYVKNFTEFPLQLAAGLPIEIIALAFLQTNYAWDVWSYCRCNRFIRVYYFSQYMKHKSELLNINVYGVSITRMLLRLAIIVQLISACFTILFCLNPKCNVTPLITCIWESEMEKFKHYTRLFSIVSLIFTGTCTIDYFPNAPHIILCYTFVMVLTRFLFASMVSTMSNKVHMLLYSRTSYEQEIYQLRDHMLREDTSIALIDRVWQYLCLIWNKKGGLQFPEFLEEAPYYLREGVLNSVYGNHLRRHKNLGLCHVDLIRQIAAQLRPRTFFPGDYVTFVNDIDECMYFVHEGSVVALLEDAYNEKIEFTLNAKEMFGFEQGLYTHCGHEFTYRASRNSVILVLKREKWIHLLQFFPASKQLIYNEQKQKEIIKNHTT